MTATEAQLRCALSDELVHLWSDLAEARQRAIVRQLNPANERSGWSIQMLTLADRIAAITKLVGPIGWEQVQVELLLDGWWDAVYTRAGFDPPPFDSARAQAVLDRRHGE